nr:uncharacterized protein LOC111420147 [Onthophagus taurus]
MHIAFGVCYRPPNCDLKLFLEGLERSLSVVYPSVDEIVVVGDFNVNFLVESPSTISLKSTLEVFALREVVDVPSRISSSSVSLIDLIFVSGALMVSDCNTLDLGFSDHLLIFCELTIQRIRARSRFVTFRNLRNIIMDNFNRDLDIMNWEALYVLPSIDEKVDYFNEVLISLFDVHAPLITGTVKKDSLPWFTSNIREMIGLREAALRRYKRTGNPVHFQYYKQLRNFVTGAIRREKKAFLEQNCVVGGPRSMWRTLRKYNVVKSNITDLPPHLADPDNINLFFSEAIGDVVVEPDADLLHFYDRYRLNPEGTTFTFSDVSVEFVERMLLSFKSTSVGSDGISLDMVRLCCPRILNVLCHIINFCLKESVYPSAWKFGLVTPVPKANPVPGSFQSVGEDYGGTTTILFKF